MVVRNSRSSMNSTVPQLGLVERVALPVAVEGGAELVGVAGRVEPDGLQQQAPGAELLAVEKLRRRDLLQRPGRCDEVVAGHVAEGDRLLVDPDAGGLPLAADHHRLFGAAHGDHDVTHHVGRAEEEDRGAGEVGIDLDALRGQRNQQGLVGALFLRGRVHPCVCCERRGDDRDCEISAQAAHQFGHSGATAKGSSGITTSE